ncbi:GTPase [Photobacterium sanctipauli]|uniref:GTPase n=1 Tax=Photobacterium sanctipauli TaxID=1342794 RepID=A0A2T3NYQ4_9GAMM|nr:dynamin family protein [Photobacterium sanctipauli]PSW21370.1 GTPase [Photobacterium sanctipauli]
MKRTTNSLGAVAKLSGGVIPLLLLAVVFPVLVLAVIGLISVFRDDLWLVLAASVLCSAVLVFGVYLLQRYKTAQRNAADAQQALDDEQAVSDYDVAPSAEWGEFDKQAFQAIKQQIPVLLEHDPAWGSLRDHGWHLCFQVAEHYHKDKQAGELAFTAPEFLLMLEEVSRRYRHFLLNHVPFAEKLKISTLKYGYQNKEKLETAKQVYSVYRVFRAMTPAGLLAEARSQIFGRIFDQVNDEVQLQLKRVFLQEVISVAIDLYSGRFSATAAELPTSEQYKQDEQDKAEVLEPLRVAVVGQVSAGKSSLINAFVGSLVAETSVLPTTDKATIHRCEVEGVDIIHLVDLPGLDGNAENEVQLLRHVVNSDILLWVVKANQPARQRDIQFKEKLDAFYQQPENRSRKRPNTILLLNQVDRLKPQGEWNPPYDYQHPNSEKAKTIKAAIDFNCQQLTPDDCLPISVKEGQEPYNLEQLADSLLAGFEEGVNTQLNRRRLEHKKLDAADQLKRLYQLGKVTFNTNWDKLR